MMRVSTPVGKLFHVYVSRGIWLEGLETKLVLGWFKCLFGSIKYGFNAIY